MPDPTPKKGGLPGEDPLRGESALTPPTGAPVKAEEQGPPAEGTAPSPTRLTQALPPLPPPQSRGWPPTLLLLLVLGLLARVSTSSVPPRTLSSDHDQSTRPPAPSAPPSVPASGPSSPSVFAAPAPTGPAQSASSLPGASSAAVGAPAGEPQTAPAPPVQSPRVRTVPPSWPRPGTALHRLHIRARQEARLLITIDGQRTIEFHLLPGQARQWSATRDFTLTSLNWGAVVLTLDGHRMPPSGNSRQQVRYIRPSAPRRDARQQAQSSDRTAQGPRSPSS